MMEDEEEAKIDVENVIDETFKPELNSVTPLCKEAGRKSIQGLVPLAPYQELFCSDLAGALKRYGGSSAPLSVIGTFLNYAGNHMLHHLHTVYRT